MRLRNSWQHVPKREGKYFAINHCGQLRIMEYKKDGWALSYNATYHNLCPSCNRFKWIEFNEEDFDE